jgi:epoxyqueuosine reductase QueG
MKASNSRKTNKTYSTQAIKAICLQAGADDAGVVEINREAFQGEREGFLRIYPRIKSVISLVKVHNRENIQSPARYVANEEYHHTGDKISDISREILRRLNELGLRGVAVNKSWPMELGRFPGKIWDVSHKTIAVEAGLGQMGLNRLVLHPKYGSFIALTSILVDGELDSYDQPLEENPCLNCNLCAVVCPTGAISKGQPFDLFSCSTHTYRDNMVGFLNWVESIVTSQNMEEYRSHFNDQETAFMWQSLMFRMSYRCSYCMAVCPAGEDSKQDYLKNKKEHVEKIVKPLRDRREPVYVVAGSKAEARVKTNPNKEARIVPGMIRRPSK